MYEENGCFVFLLQRGEPNNHSLTKHKNIKLFNCVVADFVNGAAERLVLAHQQHDFLVIEGQGSISHPMYSGVTLGLLHGCAPDGRVFCYESGRKYVKGLDHVAIPEMKRLVETYELVANLRHPCKIIGAAANTSMLSDADARADMERKRPS